MSNGDLNQTVSFRRRLRRTITPRAISPGPLLQQKGIAMKLSFSVTRHLFVITATIVGGCLMTAGCSRVRQFTASHSDSEPSIVTEIATDSASEWIETNAVNSTTSTQTHFIQTGYADSTVNPEVSAAFGHGATPVTQPSDHHSTSSPTLPKNKTLTTLQPGEDLGQLLKKTQGLVLVDFYADWCGPCRRQGKILHEMESFAAQNNARIVKVNIDKHRELASRYRVSSLPTLLAIKQGDLVNRRTGLADQTQIRSLLRM